MAGTENFQFLSVTNNGGAPQARTHNLQNQVTGVGAVTLSFDGGGNTTVDDRGRKLVWNAWNRLVRVQSGSSILVEYKHDGLKRRIVEQPAQSPAPQHYYSDQWQILEEPLVTGGNSPSTARANIHFLVPRLLPGNTLHSLLWFLGSA